MIIVKIYGGLGNQLFQYVAAKNQGLKFNHKVIIDKSWYENIPSSNTKRKYLLDKFCINEEYINVNCSKYLMKLIPFVYKNGLLLKIINQKNIYKLTNKNNYILNDYWQSLSYSSEFNNNIISNFNISPNLNDGEKKLLKSIKKKNSVAVHIRRGDYILNKNAALKHSICSVNYYESAFEIITKNINNPLFVIFSDDISWAKNNINFADNIIFKINDDDDSTINDFYLMANCNHHIIANSTFSWWGAWLSKSKYNRNHKKIVVAPKCWFLDADPPAELFPDDWIVI